MTTLVEKTQLCTKSFGRQGKMLISFVYRSSIKESKLGTYLFFQKFIICPSFTFTMAVHNNEGNQKKTLKPLQPFSKYD